MSAAQSSKNQYYAIYLNRAAYAIQLGEDGRWYVSPLSKVKWLSRGSSKGLDISHIKRHYGPLAKQNAIVDALLGIDWRKTDGRFGSED